MFYILLAEKDKALFYTYLRAFRDNLKRYKLAKLSAYFEDNYLKPERIKQWACWYRVQMFDCEWMLDTNMHVEAWHHVLKTHIMDRKKNVRIDKLLNILRSAETNNFWKWCRTKLGIRKRADSRWLAMRGKETSARSSSVCGPSDNIVRDDFVDFEDRSKQYKRRLIQLLNDCLDLLPSKAVDAERLNKMLQQQTVVRNVLRNAPINTFIERDVTNVACPQVGTSPEPQYVLKQSNKRKMSKVQSKYRRRKTKLVNFTSVSALKNSASNRCNLGFSMQLSAVGWSSLKVPESFAATSELQLQLPIVRKGSIISVGGITFLPVIMGMVVPDSGTFGFDVLNMRVGNIYLDSAGHRGGAHRMHYLYKLCAVPPPSRTRSLRAKKPINRDQIIGSIRHRHHYFNTLQVDKLTERVDSILTECITNKWQVQVTLLAYT